LGSDIETKREYVPRLNLVYEKEILGQNDVFDGPVMIEDKQKSVSPMRKMQNYDVVTRNALWNHNREAKIREKIEERNKKEE
jgi:hypothetical protein